MDDVATRLPERLAGADDAWRLAFELEHHLALQHVAEGRTGVAVRRGTGIARRVLDDDGHRVGPLRDEGRFRLL
jgi:hypothetical protein